MSERAETGRRLALYGSNPVYRAVGLTILAEEEPEVVRKLEEVVGGVRKNGRNDRLEKGTNFQQ